MRTDIYHLPAGKQRELERVVEILFEKFADAHGQPNGQRKLGRILKIVLYGSYARLSRRNNLMASNYDLR